MRVRGALCIATLLGVGALGLGCATPFAITELPLPDTATARANLDRQRASAREPTPEDEAPGFELQQVNSGPGFAGAVVGAEALGGPRPGSGPDAAPAPRPRAPGGYWSAFVYLESDSIARLWRGNAKTDYVLISAKAALPTFEGTMVRDLPLYSIERGSARAHSGMDLFYRYPVNIDARDQVSITIEVTYLRNKRAFDIAQQILAQAERIAAPFLANYPLATQIISGGQELVAELSESDGNPSAHKFSLQPGDFRADVSMKVFVLHEVDDGRGRAKSRFRSDALGGVVPCPDKKGALCRCEGAKAEGSEAGGGSCSYGRDRVDDLVYLTVSLVDNQSVFDPLLLLGNGVFECSLLDSALIERTREHLRANRHLLKPVDVGVALDTYRHAEHYIQLRGLIEDHKYGEILDVINNFGDEALGKQHSVKGASEPLHRHHDAVNACLSDLWAASPGLDIRLTWNVFHRGSRCRAATDSGVGAKMTRGKGVELIAPPYADGKCELDETAAMLTRIAALSGAPYQPSQETLWGGGQGALMEMLASKSRILNREQIALARDLTRGREKICDAVETLFEETLSPYCAECVALVADACPSKPVPALARVAREGVYESVKKGMGE